MNTKKLTVGIAGLCTAAAVAVAAYQIVDAHAAATELAAVGEKRDALVARIAETEKKIRATERRAAEAEKDSGELLKAVASVRKQQEAVAAASRPRSSGEPWVSAAADALQSAEAKLRQAQPGVEYQRNAISGGIVGMVPGPGGQTSAEEQERLARERAYQQELAKKRTEDAKRRAELQEAALVDRTTRQFDFDKMLSAAEQLYAATDFQGAIQTFNLAMTGKPADMPVPQRAKELQAALQAQNSPVDLTLNSDGVTWVAITNFRAPSKFVTTTVKILPGNYEVRGLRKGYQDVVFRLEVRSGTPPPVLTVVCR